jgi:hypothetical protein
MSFGRKGLEPDSPSASSLDALRNGPRAERLVPPSDDLARKREAFLAAERERKAQSGEHGMPGTERGYAAARVRPGRSLPMAYLLWFILGQVPAHRLYLGAYRSALIQLGLFAFWVSSAFVFAGNFNTVGPIVAIALIGWAVWVIGDVFFIHRIHRKLCRQPGEALHAASVFA